jgi:hypothetical protein
VTGSARRPDAGSCRLTIRVLRDPDDAPISSRITTASGVNRATCSFFLQLVRDLNGSTIGMSLTAQPQAHRKKGAKL